MNNEEIIIEEALSDEQIVQELQKRGITVEKDTWKVKEFNANFYVEHIKSIQKILYSKEGLFYIYEDGVWKVRNDREILKRLRDIFQELKYGLWKHRYEKEYMAVLKREVYHDGDMNPNRNIINLKNGIFDIENFILLPHDPNYLSTIQIPVNYTEGAECPRFRQFIDEVFEGDEERARVAQEWYGYSLTANTESQKALLLFGGGANGKGVFTECLSELIGDGNISNISLSELNRGFARANLLNKTANICNENEIGGTFNTQYFKAIVGEDKISAEHKNKPLFDFKPTTKLIMTMNNLPRTKDVTDGYYRRLSILNFTARFSEETRDRKLKDKLKLELAGIFLWALEGLKRLRENEFKFSPCSNMDKILSQYKEEQNPMINFFDEFIRIPEDSNHREENSIIYDAFQEYARRNNMTDYYNISSQKFWTMFNRIAEEKGIKLKKGHSNKIRYHRGVEVIKGDREVMIRPRKIKY